ncbi:hypothetical protein HK104_005369 [Borealophlyctis nickersoniae]|nr:hypothetical protein HK104_005369 [Borealophlyctis nickersoniae]
MVKAVSTVALVAALAAHQVAAQGNSTAPTTGANPMDAVLGQLLNPALSPECKAGVSAGLTSVAAPCSLISVLSVLQTDDYIGLLAGNDFVPAFCSDNCGTALGGLKGLVPVCGSTPLLNAGALAGNSTAAPAANGTATDPTMAAVSNLTAADLVGLVGYVRQVGCHQDNGKYCLQTQAQTAVKNKDTTLASIMADKEIVCTNCFKQEMQDAQNTTGVPAGIQSALQPVLQGGAGAAKNCPASSGGNSSTGANGSNAASSVVASASSLALAVVGGAAIFML